MSSTEAPAPRAGESYLVMADLVTFLVTDAGSDGRLVVVHIAVPPDGGPPPLHIHPPDEVFHVISGNVTLFEGPPGAAARRTLGPGETAHVRGGTPHTFRNLSEEPATMLLTFVPGLMMERFFVEVGHRVEDTAHLPQLDLAAEVPRVFEIGGRLGMELLAPPV